MSRLTLIALHLVIGLGSVVAGWYWYLLTGVLTFSLIGTILAILLIRKPKDAPFAPSRIPDTL